MKHFVIAALVLIAMTGIASADWVTTTVPVGAYPYEMAVNPVTNKIYVHLRQQRDGDRRRDQQHHNGARRQLAHYAVAVNPVTNKIYVANFEDSSVTVIDGATNHTTRLAVGAEPLCIAVNAVTNKIYVTNELFYSGNVTVIDGATNNTTRWPQARRPMPWR